MKVLVLYLSFLLWDLSAAQNAEPGELEPLDKIDEKEFEEFYHLAPVDSAEYERRNEALKENEEEIRKINEEYAAGEITWFDALNEFSDLPEDEFKHERTGSLDGSHFGRGLLEPSPEYRVDNKSEIYFARLRLDRTSVPTAYDSKALGHVSPVKNQLKCGSCVAFSNMGAVEVCIKKAAGAIGDYSEQQFVDCGYDNKNAFGCDGAAPHAYLKWASDNKVDLAHESQYPYLAEKSQLVCPANLPSYNLGAKISGSVYTYSGDEELLKQLVYNHGAVVASVMSTGPFENYEGGIFAGCPAGETKTDHAILVVGYGSENGLDYWLIKNSWGPDWGEGGYIRMQRGVNMCGIGKSMAAVSCEKVSGATDAPLTTKKPCLNKYSNCNDLATRACWQPSIAQDCAEACGLCDGMTPVASYTCYDKYTNCPDLTKYCYQDNIGQGCKKSCGTCFASG